MLAAEVYPVDGPLLIGAIDVGLTCGKNKKLVLAYLIIAAVNGIKAIAIDAINKHILIDSLCAFAIVMGGVGVMQVFNEK